MQVEQLEQYIELLEAHDLTRLEFEQGDVRVVLERQAPLPPQSAQAQPFYLAQPSLQSGQQQGMSPQAAGEQAEVPSQQNEYATNEQVVKAPLVGTAYRARGPEQEPFVSVGSVVKVGDVLCLLEAMKQYNEILAPCGGTVVRILFEDGDLAEYNAPLFVIDGGSATATGSADATGATTAGSQG
jgi:acetyl-CoA carboxylase biotin carboxyl carrier protein